jgi:hypothetical protein
MGPLAAARSGPEVSLLRCARNEACRSSVDGSLRIFGPQPSQNATCPTAAVANPDDDRLHSPPCSRRVRPNERPVQMQTGKSTVAHRDRHRMRDLRHVSARKDARDIGLL